MTELANTSISSLNYFFLRAVTKKIYYPEEIIDEISAYLNALKNVIETESIIEKIKIQQIIVRELSVGNYFDDLETFEQQLSDFYEENNLEIELSVFDKIQDYYMNLAISIYKEETLTMMIKSLGPAYESFICHSFEEARENNQRKNIVIEGDNLYLTYKDIDGNLGEFVSWNEDEFKEDATVYGSALSWIIDIYSVSPATIDAELEEGIFPFLFTPYDEIEQEREL